jgi:hypothetical protein
LESSCSFLPGRKARFLSLKKKSYKRETQTENEPNCYGGSRIEIQPPKLHVHRETPKCSLNATWNIYLPNFL